MPLRPSHQVPSYPIQPPPHVFEPPRVFIPTVGGSAPIGKMPIGLPTVDDHGVARKPFEKEGHPIRNFFASILYGLGVVLRSGR